MVGKADSLALITDRTQADENDARGQNARIAYNLARERPAFHGFTESARANWLAGLKGAYNVSDLNRVEKAVRFLSDLLREYGYSAAVRVRGEDWTVTDLPSAAEMERYLGNVRALVESFFVLPSTPDLPERMAGLTHEGANAIEKILLDMEAVLAYLIASFHYANEFCAGEQVELCGFRFARRMTVGELETVTVGHLERFMVKEIEFGRV